MASDDKPVRPSRGFVDAIPHNKALGIKVVSFQRAEAIFELPYDEKLVGNPDTGVLHGGAITALLDACSGASVFAALTEWQPIATLDLRIDYLRAGETRLDIELGVLRPTLQRLARLRERIRGLHADPDTDK